MIKTYLKQLKDKGHFSWQDISGASGLPEATIRKIFSGETADPRFETVVRLVSAMGGSLDKINENSQIEALIAVKDVYENRIKDIKDSNAEHVHSLKRDKKILAIAVCVLSVFLLGVLVLDILVGNAGWIRY